ncbi:MAG: LysR family transcriptional regulator [Pseudonocardia sp.]|uniref:LysR family transcriptional regulator n=1 Tax=unclassified Pseudonocardia TaxID=2619320 RepID=UPI00086A819C|nr:MULTISPECIES: LysR family transcriptional regulator [unclassified Pseudonocardia]MBN9113396.1 LysR family transcriptional regulator [Pseudonocardia sp.]ODU21148.1 MAG: LysR family transcriptional regulator [Pseudonocardia sp. SCN 72-51]ODV03728.1 MAG: LysR family transcriptional regulator [Pseudonocardia sp. SCN 73-27]
MDLPDLDDLEFFDGIATAGTLTEAARRWGVSTSAVSKRLASLERRLGAQLVRRSTRRLSLTDEGDRYAAGAARLLPLISDLEEDVGRRRGALRGRVAVHATMGLGRSHVAPALGAFAATNPGVSVELELSHLPLHVAGSPFDFAIRVGHRDDSALLCRTLLPNRRVVCASPGYVTEHGAPRCLTDIAEHQCIVIREIDTDHTVWRFGDDAAETTVRVPGTMITNDGDVATRWCVDGHGLLMRSLWHVGPLLRDGVLVRVLHEVPTPRADVVAMYPAGRHLSRRAAAALDHLADELDRRLGDATAD